MAMAPKTCPLCHKSLSLQQVNLTLAVYICEDLKCKYPVGYECIVVERKLEDMDKSIEMLNKNCGLDDWIDQVATDKEKVSSTPETNQESTQWIEDLLEKAVNDARESAKELVTEDNTVDTDFDDILSFL